MKHRPFCHKIKWNFSGIGVDPRRDCQGGTGIDVHIKTNQYHAYFFAQRSSLKPMYYKVNMTTFVRPPARPSVKPVLSETVKRLNAKFRGKLLFTIYQSTFLFIKTLLFLLFKSFFFSFVFVNMGLHGIKNL